MLFIFYAEAVEGINGDTIPVLLRHRSAYLEAHRPSTVHPRDYCGGMCNFIGRDVNIVTTSAIVTGGMAAEIWLTKSRSLEEAVAVADRKMQRLAPLGDCRIR